MIVKYPSEGKIAIEAKIANLSGRIAAYHRAVHDAEYAVAVAKANAGIASAEVYHDKMKAKLAEALDELSDLVTLGEADLIDDLFANDSPAAVAARAADRAATVDVMTGVLKNIAKGPKS